MVKVYDGDTFTVEAYPWPGLEAKASVRVDGVDTPEIRGKCEAEKQKAIEARDFVKSLILGEVVYLGNIKYGKYAGRVVADVKLEGGDNLADKIIQQGLGREYHSGAREGWCPLNDVSVILTVSGDRPFRKPGPYCSQGPFEKTPSSFFQKHGVPYF